jgi:hypothetical protein
MECLEKGNAASIPTCCNCKLVDREVPYPSNYRGCSRTRDEMGKRKLQKAPKTTSGRDHDRAQGAKSEEDTIVAITKIGLKLMKQNGCLINDYVEYQQVKLL